MGRLLSMAVGTHGPKGRLFGMRRHAAVLADRDFRWFFVGRTTSLLGSAMASVAVAFAVLGTGGGGTALGEVMAARILPLVLMLLIGGACADLLGSRAVMLCADVLRCAAQAAFAVLVLAGRPPLWAMLVLAVLSGVGEGAFGPALSALVPALLPDEGLTQANALLQVAQSATTVVGPALAGVLTAALGPAAVLAVDAASYAVSVLVLFRLPVALVAAGGRRSLTADLGAGWSAFRSRTWLWVTTVHIGLFNLLVWAPFLVLGPAVAEQSLGGSAAWGLVMAGYGGGAVLGGLALLGRRTPRPVLVGTLATVGWALPSGALALRLPLGWILVAALAAGVGSSVVGTLWATETQRRVPPELRGRVSAYGSLGSFVLGPLGLAAAGPVAAAVGAAPVFAFGALWQVVAVAVVVAVPAVRQG